MRILLCHLTINNRKHLFRLLRLHYYSLRTHAFGSICFEVENLCVVSKIQTCVLFLSCSFLTFLKGQHNIIREIFVLSTRIQLYSCGQIRRLTFSVKVPYNNIITLSLQVVIVAVTPSTLCYFIGIQVGYTFYINNSTLDCG